MPYIMTIVGEDVAERESIDVSLQDFAFVCICLLESLLCNSLEALWKHLVVVSSSCTVPVDLSNQSEICIER